MYDNGYYGGYGESWCTVPMKSMSQALKGERLFQSRGIVADVRRNYKSSANGCGYSLLVGLSCNQTIRILDEYSIEHYG